MIRSYLLAYLLNMDVRICVYCLVRAKNKKSALDRIINRLKTFDISYDKIKTRIKIVIGDLSKPLLGVNYADFDKLCHTIDVIYHNGAHVNFIYPYRVLKSVNVLSTREIIKMASKNKLKAIHYISTMSVFEGNKYKEVYHEDIIPDSIEDLWGGYPQTKLVSEKILKQARDQGMLVNIYRLGRIIGAGKKMIMLSDDAMASFVKGMIKLKFATNFEIKIDLTPVDYAAKLIIDISLGKNQINKNFHIINPQLISLKKAVKIINRKGYSVKFVSFQQWLEKIKADNNNPMFVYKGLLSAYGKEILGYTVKIETFNVLSTIRKKGLYILPAVYIIFKNYLNAVLKK